MKGNQISNNNISNSGNFFNYSEPWELPQGCLDDGFDGFNFNTVQFTIAR